MITDKPRSIENGSAETSVEKSSGLGKEIIKKGKEKCYQLFPDNLIKISAQIHLQEFYESLGFKRQGEPYDEDGILHIEMLST